MRCLIFFMFWTTFVVKWTNGQSTCTPDPEYMTGINFINYAIDDDATGDIVTFTVEGITDISADTAYADTVYMEFAIDGDTVIGSLTEAFENYEAETLNSQTPILVFRMYLTCTTSTSPNEIMFNQPINDINNHKPQFSEENYIYNLPMPFPSQIEITQFGPQIIATDIDITNTGMTFEIVGSDQFSFTYVGTVDDLGKSHTATLVATRPLELAGTQTFILRATDVGNPVSYDDVVLTINVDETNSVTSAPFFDEAYYEVDYEALLESSVDTPYSLQISNADESTEFTISQYEDNLDFTYNNGELQIWLTNELDEDELKLEGYRPIVITATASELKFTRTVLILRLPTIEITTTACPTETTVTTTDCPICPVTEASTACPTETTVTVTDCPICPVTEASTACPTETTVTTTDCPICPVTEASTACPTETTVTTTDCPICPVTEASTACPTEASTTATDCPICPVTEPTTDCPLECPGPIDCSECTDEICTEYPIDCSECTDEICTECPIDCSECTDEICPECPVDCSECTDEICPECPLDCSECTDEICPECPETPATDCSECTDEICPECPTDCSECTDEICPECPLDCSECTDEICPECPETPATDCSECTDEICPECPIDCSECTDEICPECPEAPPTDCSECTDEICQECPIDCSECTDEICPECPETPTTDCSECTDEICPECPIDCSECTDDICPECPIDCSECTDEICPECPETPTTDCSECTDEICPECPIDCSECTDDICPECPETPPTDCSECTEEICGDASTECPIDCSECTDEICTECPTDCSECTDEICPECPETTPTDSSECTEEMCSSTTTDSSSCDCSQCSTEEICGTTTSASIQASITFPGAPFKFSLTSSETLSTATIPLRAISTIEEDIQYELNGHDSDLINFDETTAILTNKELLEAGIYEYTVTARGQLSTVTKTEDVTIVVTALEICSSGPVMTYAHFLTYVDENEAGPILPLTIENTEDEQQVELDYKIVSVFPSAGEDLFYQEDGTIHCNELDRESDHFEGMTLAQYIVIVEVTAVEDEDAYRSNNHNVFMAYSENSRLSTRADSSQCPVIGSIRTQTSQTQITVVVEDVNDNAPVFATTKIVIGYPSKSLLSTITPSYLVQVEATDADIGENAELAYYVSSSSVTIHSSTGVIYPTQAFPDDDFTFTVTARDQNGNGLWSSNELEVEVKILDQEHISVLTVKNYLLEDVETKVSELNELANINIRSLKASVLSTQNTRRTRSTEDYYLVITVYALDVDENLIVAEQLESMLEDVDDLSVNTLPDSECDCDDECKDKCSEECEDDCLESCDEYCQDNYSDCSNTGLIAAVSIISVLLVLLIVGFVAFYYFKLRKNKSYNNMEEESENSSRPHSPPQFAKNIAAARSSSKLGQISDKPERRSTGILFWKSAGDPNDHVSPPATSPPKERKSVVFNTNVEQINIHTPSDNENVESTKV